MLSVQFCDRSLPETESIPTEDREGNFDLYLMNADGSHVVQLTSNPFASSRDRDINPVWSPDNAQLAFASSRDGGFSYISFNLYKMNIDGSNVVQLTGPAKIIGNERSPAWSPDGSQIAFESTASGITTFDIYVMNADGTGILQLTDGPSDNFFPAWSSDGSQIAFVSARGGIYDIYVINADGTHLLQLTQDAANNSYPAWSPDGGWIAFASDRSGSADIYVMKPDGSGVTQLTHNVGAYDPAWSPDGSQIVFVSDRYGDSDLYVMNADGSNVIQLTGK